MVKFSLFYELCGCKDLCEVQLEHGGKLTQDAVVKTLVPDQWG